MVKQQAITNEQSPKPWLVGWLILNRVVFHKNHLASQKIKDRLPALHDRHACGEPVPLAGMKKAKKGSLWGNEPGSKLLVLGIVIQPLVGILILGPYKPLRTWVDDHPLLYGKNGSWSTRSHKWWFISWASKGTEGTQVPAHPPGNEAFIS